MKLATEGKSSICGYDTQLDPGFWTPAGMAPFGLLVHSKKICRGRWLGLVSYYRGPQVPQRSCTHVTSALFQVFDIQWGLEDRD